MNNDDRDICLYSFVEKLLILEYKYGIDLFKFDICISL